MADRSASTPPPTPRLRTICLPIPEAQYRPCVLDPKQFRDWLWDAFDQFPELFPDDFAKGFTLVDCRQSKKLDLMIRRIQLRDGTRYSVRPAFVMPYMTARTDDVGASVVPSQIRGSVLGPGRGVRTRPHVLLPTGMSTRSDEVRSAPRCATPTCPNTCSPTNIIKPRTETKAIWPPPWPTGVAWEWRWRKRLGPTT